MMGVCSTRKVIIKDKRSRQCFPILERLFGEVLEVLEPREKITKRCITYHKKVLLLSVNIRI